MMFETKTHDGKRILLDTDEVVRRSPQFKSFPLLFGLFALMPWVFLSPIFMMLLEYDAITNVWIYLLLHMVIFMPIPFLFRFLIFTKQYIYAYLLIIIVLSHRMFLIGAILWFIMAKSPYLIVLSCFALCYCEYQNKAFLKKISDKELIRMFTPCFYLDALEENYLFDENKGKKIKLNEKQTKTHERLLNIESWGGRLIAFSGGGLFLYSFLLRDNFDLRATIVGIIFLFIGMGVREFMIEYAKAKRAIKLKQAGTF